MKKEIADHYDWVEYAKGIGIILVVYGHVARGVFNAGMSKNVELFKLVDSIIYSFHMPLFFFISGLFFVSSIRRRTAKGLLFSKLDTIAYPYLVWSLIQGFVKLLVGPVTNFGMELDELYSILWRPIDQFWFLYVLFLIFVIMTVVYKLISNVSLLFILSVLLFVFGSQLNTAWSALNITYGYFVYFCSGMMLSQYLGKPAKDHYIWILVSAGGFTLLQIFEHSQVFEISLTPYISLLIGGAGIMTTVCISKLLAQNNIKILRIIGGYSLGIYLVHILFGSGFRIIMQKTLGVDNSSFHLMFGTLLGIALPIIFVKSAELMRLSFLFTAPKISTKND